MNFPREGFVKVALRTHLTAWCWLGEKKPTGKHIHMRRKYIRGEKAKQNTGEPSTMTHVDRQRAQLTQSTSFLVWLQVEFSIRDI